MMMALPHVYLLECCTLPATNLIGLRRWIWGAFAKSALIPLLLVETVLIAVYLLTNGAIREAQIDYLRENALTDLQYSAKHEGRIIDEQLTNLGALTDLYRNLTAKALQDEPVGTAEALMLTVDGVRYSPKDLGAAAVFYANGTSPAHQDLAKVARLESLSPLMEQLKERQPLIASVYFNSWDSLNYIYPWFSTQDQYPHDMVIPDYNFYYLADASHNPARKVVWTDVYLDPAGQGWMMSAVAPVYRGDFLEGVSGMDITVGSILQQIEQLSVPWSGYAMLVSNDLRIMAMPKSGEADFGLDELTDHSYDEAIRSELFKPEDFNLRTRNETRELAKIIAAQPEGIQSIILGERVNWVAWTTIKQTGWRLLTVVDEANIFKQTNALAGRYQQLGYLMIAGLIVFYLLFFAFMWIRTLRLSGELRSPITKITQMMSEIGQGHRQPLQVSSHIYELNEMARHATAFGEQLERSAQSRAIAQQRLDLVLESATEGLWEHSFISGRVTLSRHFCQRFGLLDTELSHKQFLQRVHVDDLSSIKQAYERVRAGHDEVYKSEFRFSDASGCYHWLLSRGRVLEHDSSNGMASLIAGTHVDIDELKQIEAQLRDATLQAQSASEAKSRFISSMSHELRTPLNAIQGFAQLMTMKRKASEQTEDTDYLDEILLASRHLNHLVGDILDWSSIQTHQAHLDLQAVDIGSLMSECAELTRGEAQEQHLQFHLVLPDEPLRVRADPQRLRQVLINLLSNAIKYNRPEGHVTLSYQVTGGCVRLMVEDNGLGIDAHLQEKLFEPFQRLGRENTAIPGTGIGLSLCREFAQRMQAQMGLHSERGIGSRFWIELALLDRVTLSAAGSRPESQLTKVNLPHLLYVEDDSASQLLVRKALADLAQVHVVGTGHLALQRIIDEPPALLLLDLHLPDMDGDTLLNQLRADPTTRNLPIVLLSAAPDIAHLLALDCQGTLSKPLDLDELRALVRELLSEVPVDVI